MRPDLDLHAENIVTAYAAGETVAGLARKYQANAWSIRARLLNAGIPLRSWKQAFEKRLNLRPEQVQPFLFLVDGLVLGDGGVDPKGSLRLEQNDVRRGWVNQVQQELLSFGCSSKIIPCPSRTRSLEGREVRSGNSSLLYTSCVVEMQQQRVRWYPEGVKRVPRDLRLTPSTLAHWFAGDGTYDRRGTLFLCTDGFFRDDTEWLVRCLDEHLGVQAHLAATPRIGQFKISITQLDEAMKIKNLIESLLPDCCRYKLQHVRPRVSSP